MEHRVARAHPRPGRGLPSSSLPRVWAIDGGGIETLTPAERLVLAELRKGRSTAEIANALFVSEATVRTHLTHIYGKLGVRGRVELLASLAARVEPGDPPPLPHPFAERLGPPAPQVPVASSAPAVSARVCLISGATVRGVAVRTAGLLAVAVGLAHLSIAAWPLVGPGFLAGQTLLSRSRNLRPTRLAMLVLGVLLSAEQLAVLVALHLA